MLLLTFSWKNFFIFNFALFIFNNTRIFCASFMEILFLHDTFLHGKIPHVILSPQLLLPQPKKISLKISVHFPIIITICKHWSKYVTCSPSHGDFGGVSRPQRFSFRCFYCAEYNGYFRILIRWLWEKMSVGRGVGALQFFSHLKRALELLISVSMSPLTTF